MALSAGVAYAEVSVSGNARVGLSYNEAAAQETTMDNRVRIVFGASGETDGGLSWSVSSRIRTGNEAGASVNALNELGVTISGAFGSLTVGSESSAAEYAVGDLAGVGYIATGAGNENLFLNTDVIGARALYSYTAGDLSVYASAGQLGTDAYALGATYTTGGLTLALGYEDISVADHLIVGVTYALGDTKVKATYGEGDVAGVKGTQAGVSAAHTMGALTLAAYYRTTELSGLGAVIAEADNYGLGASYDLGGGVAFKAGVADINGTNRAEMGMTFSF
ncbi:porin [Tabrizicola sp.]|uniref:porin n=1 Tax=Tabrizicola sp. TaxID=2005166 RepID=UPI003D276F00